MANDTPSWKTSALTQMAFVSLFAFLVAGLLVAYGVVFHSMSAERATLAMAPFATAFTALVVSYATARKVNGEAKPPEVKP